MSSTTSTSVPITDERRPREATTGAEHETLLGPEPIFVTHYRGRGEALVVVVPPLFEELARTRKQLVNLARTLAAGGVDVVRFDYYGTGLSEGDFADVSIDRATRDLARVLEAYHRPSMRPPSLVGVRFGALLATSPRVRAMVERVVAWEPVLDPKSYWREMVRIELTNEMVSLGGARRSQADLEAALRAGATVTIDGYRVSPRLYAELDTAATLETVGVERLREAGAVALYWETKPAYEAASRAGLPAFWIEGQRFSFRHIRTLDPCPTRLFDRTRDALGALR